MTELAVLVVVLPLITTVAAVATGRSRVLHITVVSTGLATLGATLALVIGVTRGQPFGAVSGYLYVDSLSAFFLLTIAFVIALASLGSAAYLRAEEVRADLGPVQVRVYLAFFGVFSATMLATFETGNLGLLFVLIEGSTLASTVLVALDRRSTSLEAAWKYIIISSLGVTVALVGTLFLYYAASSLPGTPVQRLTWPFLFDHARQLQPVSLRLAFLLAVIGYGSKVGLAPMHTWLPDAHSEAPSPASAMLSAGLLNTGMYAIIRFQGIVAARLGDGYPAHVLLIFGFLSILIGALFIVLRGNFKRIFAYSSVEHMGIIAVGLGFGGVLGLYGALLHTLNHAIGKAVLFLTSGDIVLVYRTRVAAEVRGALGAMPLGGGVLILATLAVAGSPPFGLFLSELTIVRAGFVGQDPALSALLLLLLVVAFVPLVATVASMVMGAGPRRPSPYPDHASRVWAGAPLLAGLGVLLLLGLWIPGGLDRLIMASIRTIT